ncbi:uncharacterized protein (TIGR02757 family) [Anseongella ginsenosidimutans]|uniref:Uncharacterized protein (TIGR02757 family) n=1 Tax=Anseongella ginsenosidimutans TaxID=496056 RepID=A0A4R3KU74_9SPHI|nr:uncharacterized protein (TIGR02757 family) [Anseongella ginsenosidimutans]
MISGGLRNGGIEGMKGFLDAKVEQYNQPGFIENDPVCIPHLFTRKQDIEIMGFWAAVLAWGQRKTIIAKCRELIGLMDGTPYEFITQHEESDLKRLLGFKHRTFNATDTLYFIEFFRRHYAEFDSLEEAFTGSFSSFGATGSGKTNLGKAALGETNSNETESGETGSFKTASGEPNPGERDSNETGSGGSEPMEACLNAFRRRFFSLEDFPRRTMKHIPAPERDSACKRLNMFLRWMVRKDDKGVDFGLWTKILPASLICPCDVHVERVARKLELIRRPRGGWQTALELTRNLRKLDPSDPVKYDFALFGMGVAGEI